MIQSAEMLSKAEASVAAGYLRDAHDQYSYVLASSQLTDADRHRAELALAKLTIAGVRRDVTVRMIGWLVLVAAIVVGLVMIATANSLTTIALPGASRVQSIMYAEAVGWMLSGAASCYLLHRFAELLDRARSTEARLLLISSKHEDV